MERHSEITGEADARLTEVLRRLRACTPKRAPLPTAVLDLSRFERQGAAPVPRAVITLRGIGCGWTRRGGGCTMCGHDAGASMAARPDARVLCDEFDRAFAGVDARDVPILCLYNGGSVLNPDECPEETLAHIARCVKATPGIREWVVETRAEYVDEVRLTALAQAIAPIELVVAMGLESADDEVRRLSVHKGFSVAGFRRACSIVKRVARLRLYVLIKPPWLTEAEAVNDAVATIRLAYALGADDVHVEPLTIQNYTLLHALWRLGRYRLPWLWSVAEVLRRLDTPPVYVSPFAHVPRPMAIPHNCGTCDAALISLLVDHYNKHADPAVFEAVRCECLETWRAALALHDERSLAARVSADLPALEAAVSRVDTTPYTPPSGDLT